MAKTPILQLLEAHTTNAVEADLRKAKIKAEVQLFELQML